MRSTLFLVLIALVCCASTLAATRARAEEATEPPARAEALLRAAEAADERLELARALASYEAASAADPAGRAGARAAARAAHLRARAEGGFAPLAALERVRRDPNLAVDAREIDDLVRAADAFPPGRVRVEAWGLAAEAYAHRLDRPASALPLYRRIATDPHADDTLAQRAARDLATSLVARGELDPARDAARLGDAKLAGEIARAARRRHLHHASICTLAALLVLAGRAALRGGRSAAIGAARAASPLALAYAAYVGVGGGLLASGYEAGTGKPFYFFGAALVPVLLLARAWSAAGGTSRAARSARAVLSAASALAAAFLSVEQVDVAYLEGLGL